MAQEETESSLVTANELLALPNTREQPAAVKIKLEKIDPEIENKINNLTSNSKNNENQSSEDDQEGSQDESESSQDEDEEDDEEDEKKTIEPVKSSNEILMELFNVFNAAPPEELLDDKNLIRKATKKVKKEKKKKQKRSRSAGGEISGSEDESGTLGKHKKKKKHKHKHKDGEKSKEKKKRKDKDKERDKEKSKEKKTSKDPDTHKNGERHKERIGREQVKVKEEKYIEERKNSYTSEIKRHQERDVKDTAGSKRLKTDEKNPKDKRSTNPFYSTTSYDNEIKKETVNERDRYCKTDGKIEIKIKKDFRQIGRHKSDDDISEISLSDEESYLRGKEKQSDYSKYKSRNSFYTKTESSHSRDGDRKHSKERHHGPDKDRDRDRQHERGRGSGNRGYHSRHSRSRSRSRSHDLGIDKKRLLEIARKNAITMFKRGNLPGCANMTEDVKDRVLLKMRYGGRTVEDLTEFCKKISNGEHLSDLSSDEGSDVDKSGNVKAFHHPFQLKEREPIVMHIRNSKPIIPAVKSSENTKTITMQFPVSSGQQHRMTEAWVPVEPKDKLLPLPVLPAAVQSTNIFKSTVTKNALGKPLPTEGEQEPAFKPVPETNTTAEANNSNETNSQTSINIPIPQPHPPPLQQPPPVPPVVNSYLRPIHVPTPVPPPPLAQIPPNPPTHSIPIPVETNNFVPDVPVPSSTDSIFPQTLGANFDVSAIISKRLNAMRRLQENPMDSEALKLMYNSQKEMSSWAASKHMPGQFTGSTGATILKPNELNSGPQVWAKKNQLTSTKPVTGGMGMHLLQKMGWRPGEGLGREKNGSLQPLLLDVKLDKRGLVAQEDIRQPNKKRTHNHNAPLQNQNVQDKHPVCLLNELTTKYKWTPPLYNLVHENGPSHSRMFLFSVQVNNETYTPTKLSNTKKDAKLAAAKLCLQQMGILPSG